MQNAPEKDFSKGPFPIYYTNKQERAAQITLCAAWCKRTFCQCQRPPLTPPHLDLRSICMG